MLKEIKCVLFSHGKITFREGLNIILGDDDAKNSIGKSTALMVIDFVQGGDSFLTDDAGVINALGHHLYDFEFEFLGKNYFFSRSTDAPEIVYTCDENYKRLEGLSIENYRKLLKELYGLGGLESSFRSIVSPFIRIWRKGGLEPDQPFIATSKEPSSTSINRLIDLFDRHKDISAEIKVINEQKERRKLIASSMDAKIIPRVNKTQYRENKEIIAANSLQLEQLKQGVGGAINAYEALFDENLRQVQQRKNELSELKQQFQQKITRLKREISGITPRLASNIALVAEYFPTVDIQKLEQVEAFHQKIGGFIKKELKEELDATIQEEAANALSIASLEHQIQAALNSKGLPNDLFTRIFELKEVTDKALEENNFFDTKANLDETIKISARRLEEIHTGIFLQIESKINSKLKAFNKVVYGPERNSSELRIKSASSYNFSSPEDSGTGKSYAGLIGFDLAILSLTKLPFVIHDSVVYKNIEIVATTRILRILAFIKSKQVFLSFDEAKKFGPKFETLINKCTALKISNDDLLYSKDWRDKKNS